MKVNRFTHFRLHVWHDRQFQSDIHYHAISIFHKISLCFLRNSACKISADQYTNRYGCPFSYFAGRGLLHHTWLGKTQFSLRGTQVIFLQNNSEKVLLLIWSTKGCQQNELQKHFEHPFPMKITIMQKKKHPKPKPHTFKNNSAASQ